jgi:UDP-N-acetylenolpyruvoylglucosamine reductase
MKNIYKLNDRVIYAYDLSHKHNFKKKAGNAVAYYQLDLRSEFILNDLNMLSKLLLDESPFVIFGSHSNLLITERGYDGLFIDIRPYTKGIEYCKETNFFNVSADCILNDFVKYASNCGYDFSDLISIPGLLGSAICGNSGKTDGMDICKFVKSIEVYNFINGKYEILYPDEKFFAKRNSFIKEKNKINMHYLIKSCTLQAEYINEKESIMKMQENLKLRKNIDTEATNFGTAGSFWISSLLPKKYFDKGLKVRDLMKEIGLNKVNFNGARYITEKFFLTTDETTTDKDVAKLLHHSIKEINNAFGFIPQNEVVILDHDGRIDAIEFINRYL